MDLSVIGHEKILKFFEQAIKNNKLSHAYCFIGPNHVGKRKVAETIAAELLGIEISALGSSPDFLSVDRENDEKTEKLKKDISLEQILNLIFFLRQGPFKKNNYKAAIIGNANLLNKSGSNALLRALEETRGKAVVFLLATSESEVLPTIMSRAQKIFFAPASDNDIRQYLEKSGIGDEKTDEIISFCRGLPGKAVQWLNEPESLEMQKKEKNRFESLFCAPFYIKLRSVEDMFGDKKDHIKARIELENALDVWHITIADSLKKKIAESGSSSPRQEFVNNTSVENLLLIESKIANAKAKIWENIHPRLIVEDILLAMP